MSKVFKSVCLMITLALLFILLPSSIALAAEEKLFVVDLGGLIHELDPETGAVLNTFPTPEPCSSYEGLAYGEGRMFFINGLGTNTVYEIHPETGAVINSFPLPGAGPIDALGFSGDRLFASDIGNFIIWVLDPDTGAIITNYPLPPPMAGGGSFAGTRGSIFFTDNATFPNMIYELDPMTGAVINAFPAPAGVSLCYGLGFSCSRQTLFLGDLGPATIYEVDADNGAVFNSFPSPGGAITALAADEYIPGDVNGDGRANVLDMIRIGMHWGETGTPWWIPEDIKADGAINVLDMIIVGMNWTG